MRKLLVPKEKENVILDEIKKISPNKDDYISVILPYNSPYVSKNKDELYSLLEKSNEKINYKEEFINDGLEIDELIVDDEKTFRIHPTDSFYYYIRSYIFMVLPKANDEDYMEYNLIPSCIFPLIFNSYEDIFNIVPDLVLYLIDKGLAFISDDKE